MGIIKNLKGHYRSKLHTRLITELDLDPNRKIQSVNILDATNLLSEAWKSVKKETVANCFKHGGFDLERQNREELDVLGDVNLPGPMTREELEDHINIDEEVEVTGKELVEQIKRN